METGDSFNTPPPTGGLDLLLTGLFFLGLLAAVIFLLLWARRVIRRSRDLQAEADLQESRFEEELKSQARYLARPPVIPGTVAAPDPPLAATMASVPGLAPALSVPPAPGEQPRAQSLAPASGGGSGPEEFARKLMGLRVVAEFQGRISLPVPPDALIYRLRRGGTCLITPRLESADLMRYFCRRFDLVFAIDDQGDAFVLERFQTRLPGLLDDPSTQGKANLW